LDREKRRAKRGRQSAAVAVEGLEHHLPSPFGWRSTRRVFTQAVGPRILWGMHLAERLGLPRGRRRRAGLTGLAITYALAGINHFVNPAFYLGIMPSFMPAPALMVAASGVAEVGLGLAVLPPPTRRLAGWGLVAMLLVFCVVHVDMVVRPAEYPGVPYAVALLRLPVQALLIAWALGATRPEGSSRGSSRPSP